MNPQEIPKQVDLSKDVASQGIHLSPEQQKSFQEYLDTLKAEEKQGIITLSQAELGKLRNILETQVNTGISSNIKSAMKNELGDFIGEQKSEGFSLTDLVAKDAAFSEQIGNTEKLVSQALFGTPGIMKDMNLSDTAQNIFAAGMSLALIEEMGKNPSGIDIAKLKQNPPDMSSLETLAQKMLPLALLSKEKEILSTPAGNKEVSKLHISGNGDTNALFQNPLEAQKFITGILSGEITEDRFEAYIEERNNKSATNIDVKTIQEHLQRNLGAIESRLKDAQTAQDPENAAQEAAAEIAPDASEEEKQSILEAFLKLFKEFVDGFIGVGEKVFGPIESKTGNDEAPDTSDNREDSETTQESLKNTLLNLPATDLGEINKKRLIQELEDPEFFKKIEGILEGIDTEKSASNTLKELFGEKHTFQKFSAELKTSKYPQLGDISQYSAGNIFEGVLTEYARYRNSPGVQGKETNRTTWEEWAQIRKTQTWSTDGK